MVTTEAEARHLPGFFLYGTYEDGQFNGQVPSGPAVVQPGGPGFFSYSEIQSLQVKVPGEGSIVLGVVIVLALTWLFWYAIDEATTATLSPGL